jgi:hypothetical protein
MIRIVYRARPDADPPLLDALGTTQPVAGELVAIDLESLDLRAFPARVQDAIRTAEVTHWTAAKVERRLAAPPRSAESTGPVETHDRFEVVLEPSFDVAEAADAASAT